MLNVKNDIKLRPILATLGTLIENMSRTGLARSCLTTIFFLRNSNFYMLKSNIDYFCGVISLLAQVFIVSSNRVSYAKKNGYGSVFVIGLYLQKAMYHPCDLDL